MKIINKVTDKNYTQWIEGFVTDVLKQANIKYSEAIIDDIEDSKRIFIIVDEQEYTIRTWIYRVVEFDKNDIPCAENVEYTLYKMVDNAHSSHGEEINEGRIKITWVNTQ